MQRRKVLALGLGGIAAPFVLGRNAAMAQGSAKTIVYVSNAGTKDIHVFAMDRASGELTPLDTVAVPGTEKTSLASLPMAMTPDKRFLYAQLRAEPYPVSAYAVDKATGRLKHLGITPLVDQMAYLNTDRSGKFLLGASYVGAKLAIYPITREGTVAPQATQILDTKPKAHCVVVDAANKHVYVPVLGGDEILELDFDAAKGTVSPNGPGAIATRKGAAPPDLPPQRALGLSDDRDDGDDGRLCGQSRRDAEGAAIRRDRLLQGAAGGLRHPRDAGRPLRLRRRTQDQHPARLRDRPGQGHADPDRQLPDREDAARLQYRGARPVSPRRRHGFGVADRPRDRPGQRQAQRPQALPGRQAAQLDRISRPVGPGAGRPPRRR